MKIAFWNKSVPKKNVPKEGTFTIGETTIPYTVITRAQSKYIRITILREGTIRVTTPHTVDTRHLNTILLEKSSWILSKVNYFLALPPSGTYVDSKKEYTKNKGAALLVVNEAVKKYNKLYNFTYQNISIKNQKTLWGSCSRRGNLNFNYKILQLPERLADYIIVHELCHLQEFNHSKRFWDLVAQTIPNHHELRSELKSTGLKSL